MIRAPLSAAEVRRALTKLRGWKHQDDALTKSYRLASFRDAIAFIGRLAFEAEELDHHPELENVYDKVAITLRTHDAGNKVTRFDVELATRIESIATQMLRPANKARRGRPAS